MDQEKQGSGMMKVVIDAIRDALPEMVHPCPYFGRHQMFNAKVDRKVLSIFPAAKFRLAVECLFNGKLITKPSIDIETFD